MNPPSQAANRRRLIVFVGTVLLLLGLAAAWRWTPMSDYLTPAKLQQLLATFDSPWTRGMAAVAALTAALSLMVPLSLLAIFAGAAFGGLLGFGYILLAALASSALVFAGGRALGQRAVERLAGDRINRLSTQLSNHGVVTVATARLVPIAPFTVFNLVAGASQLRFRAFIVGSFIALAPGMAALTVFSDKVKSAFNHPSPASIAVMVLIGVAIVVAAVAVKRRFSAQS